MDTVSLKFNEEREMSSILGTEPPKYVRGKEGLGGGGSMYEHKNISAARLENSHIYKENQFSLNYSVDHIHQQSSGRGNDMIKIPSI